MVVVALLFAVAALFCTNRWCADGYFGSLDVRAKHIATMSVVLDLGSYLQTLPDSPVLQTHQNQTL